MINYDNGVELEPIIVHSWKLEIEEAAELQKSLASKVILDDEFKRIDKIAGVDVAYDKESDEVVAGVVVLHAETLETIDVAWAREKVNFPYIPGLFSFRELPSIISALEKLKHTPDLFVCDGQGIAHPLRFGLACHLGVIFDVPAIGCAKTRLVGDFEAVENHRGAFSYLVDNGQVVGAAVRTQDGINPLFVSPGHRISIKSAIQWSLSLSPKYRLPESTRKADQLVRNCLKID